MLEREREREKKKNDMIILGKVSIIYINDCHRRFITHLEGVETRGAVARGEGGGGLRERGRGG